MNSGYADYVIAQIEEILDRYDGDGLFIDIVRYIGAACVCATCLAQIVEQGVDPADPAQLRAARRPEAALLLPDAQPITWEWDDGYVRLTLLRVDEYAVVQLVGAE